MLVLEVSGIDKGIRRLSELNVLLSISLTVAVLGGRRHRLPAQCLVMNVGDYWTHLPGMRQSPESAEI